MRLRYLIGIWVLGALIAGFACGQIVERNHWLNALTKARQDRFRVPTSQEEPSGEQAKSVYARC